MATRVRRASCARETPGKITLETSGDPETVLPVMQRLLVRADTL